MYDNFITRTNIESGAVSSSNRQDDVDHVAFIGEVAFLPTWDISKHVSVFGGYEALWLPDVAIASQELGSTQPIRQPPGLLSRGDGRRDGPLVRPSRR